LLKSQISPNKNINYKKYNMNSIKIPILFLLIISICTTGCIDDLINPDNNGCNIERSETITNGGGFSDRFSPRNHVFEFDITEKGALDTISVTTNSDQRRTTIHLSKGSGFSTINLTSSGSPSTSETIQNFGIEETGKHTLVVTTDEGDETNYHLSICADNIENFTKLTGKIDLQTNTWKPTGGGYSNHFSARNHEYTFSVTEENSYIDITLATKSDQVRGRIHVFQGQGVNLSNIKNSGSVSSYETISELLIQDTGNYTLVVATDDNIGGDYELNLFSLEAKVTDFLYVEKIVHKKTNAWIPNGGGYSSPESPLNHTWEFQTLSEDAIIDVVLATRSDQIRGRIYLFKGSGNNIEIYNSGSVSSLEAITGAILNEIGTYQIVVTTDDDNSGDYDLSIYATQGEISEPVKR